MNRLTATQSNDWALSILTNRWTFPPIFAPQSAHVTSKLASLDAVFLGAAACRQK